MWTEHAKLLDEKEAAAVRADAAQARDRAVELAEQIERLEMLDQARAAWYVHTAPGRDLAERARTELDSRGADVDEPADTVTGQEWLEEHQRAVAEDEQHQVVTEADVADSTEDDDVTADERWDAADGAAVLDAIEACHVEDERREQLARWAEDDARDAAEPELADAWD